MRLDAGLVFLADSRTSAGVDHINTFRKMHVFARPGGRALGLMTSGTLALSQSMVYTLRQRPAADGANRHTVGDMFEAAKLGIAVCGKCVHAARHAAASFSPHR